MNIKDAVRKFRVPNAKIKQLIEEGALPYVDDEIPNEIKGIGLVDRIYNMINYLNHT